MYGHLVYFSMYFFQEVHLSKLKIINKSLKKL